MREEFKDQVEEVFTTGIIGFSYRADILRQLVISMSQHFVFKASPRMGEIRKFMVTFSDEVCNLVIGNVLYDHKYNHKDHHSKEKEVYYQTWD